MSLFSYVEENELVGKTASLEELALDGAEMDVEALDKKISMDAKQIEDWEASIETAKEELAMTETLVEKGEVNAHGARLEVASLKTLYKDLYGTSKLVSVGTEDADIDPVKTAEMASTDKRNIVRKAIDAIRKAYVKLNAMIKKAMVKIMSTFGRLVAKTEAVYKKIKSSKDEWKDDTLIVEDKDLAEDLAKYIAAAAAISQGTLEFDVSKVSIDELINEAINFGNTTFKNVKVILDGTNITKELTSLNAVELIQQADESFPGDLDPNDDTFVVSVVSFHGSTFTVVAVAEDSKDDDGVKQFKLYLKDYTIDDATKNVKVMYVGTHEDVLGAAQLVKKQADGFKKDVDKIFRDVKNIEKVFDKVAKKYESDANSKVKSEYNFWATIYKKAPLLAYKVSYGQYKRIQETVALLNKVANIATDDSYEPNED